MVPADRMAEVVGATQDDIIALGHRMGLSGPPDITDDQRRRSYTTVIRRNWHLLPLEQIEQLLGWSTEYFWYILKEDDFLFHKLGDHKPACEPLRYEKPSAEVQEKEEQIAELGYARQADRYR